MPPNLGLRRSCAARLARRGLVFAPAARIAQPSASAAPGSKFWPVLSSSRPDNEPSASARGYAPDRSMTMAKTNFDDPRYAATFEGGVMRWKSTAGCRSPTWSPKRKRPDCRSMSKRRRRHGRRTRKRSWPSSGGTRHPSPRRTGTRSALRVKKDARRLRAALCFRCPPDS